MSRTIRNIETILKKRKKIDLQGKKKLEKVKLEYEVVLVDATEHPIERPKKATSPLFREKENAQ